MHAVSTNTKRGMLAKALCLLLLALAASPLHAGKKKAPEKPKPSEMETTAAKLLKALDYSRIVWPNPPAIPRVKYVNFFTGEKFVPKQEKQQKKASWMDRLSGVTAGELTQDDKPRFQLVLPYGVAVDSKGSIYVADSKVRAIFIYNAEKDSVELIKNGEHANFKWLTGLAIDDSDRLFAADSGLHRILVFDASHKVEGGITQGLVSPGGMAIDNENRLLYVADAELDLVQVYDADPPFRLLRTMGKIDQQHRLIGPGEFSRPTNVAVDGDGNLFVSDTFNNRIQVFDADGNFLREFGKHGDAPGYFARPKGIAVDADGHVWVVDEMQNRIQAFTQEGRLLIYIGGRGLAPGQFQAPIGITIDKNNRIITSEQYPGRVQIFRYVTNAEAKAEFERIEAEQNKRRASAPAAKDAAAAKPAPAGTKQ